MSVRVKSLTRLWILAAMLIAGLPALAYNVKGTVVDAADKSGMAEATVRLLHAKDSTFYKGAAADVNGVFEFKDVKNGKYIIEATYLGYDKGFADVTVKGASVKDVEVVMTESSILLAEATITGVQTPIKVMQDTVEYNANSYTTQPNAVVEDLLKRLPGVEVGDDGAITANGKSVSKILVDGKEFFSDDPKVASKNLPVDMVDKLQVVDRKSDLARMTGVDDGEEETVINLTVKKGMQKGYFGTVLAGYGTDDRYTVNFNLNRFWDGNQITLLGNANNVNELGFTDSNGNRFQRFGGNRGINNSQAFGLNFNVGKEEIIRVGGNVMYSHSDRNSITRRNRQYFLPDEPSYFSNSSTDATDKGHNVRADFRVEWNPDSFNKLDFRPRFSFNMNDSWNDAFSHEEYKNMNLSNSVSNGKSYEASGQLIYNHNFKQRRGRSFSVFTSYNMSNVREHSSVYTYTKYLQEEEENEWDSYEQYLENHNWSNTVRARATWTEPIGDVKNGNFLTFSYHTSMRWNDSDKFVYQRDAEALSESSFWPYTLNGVDYEIPMPVWGNSDYELKDNLSSQYRSTYYAQDIRFGYKKVSKSSNLDLGLSFVPQRSASKELTGSKASIPTRWTLNFAPYLTYRYKWTGMRSLQIRYNGRGSQPSMTQLQPVADTSNPLNIVQGNPNLKPYFNHSMNIRFQDFNGETQRSLMLMGDFSMTQNSIVSRTDVNTATGARTTTYENVNGVWSGRLMNMLSMPFRNKNWQFSNHIFTNFNQNVGFLQ
ncbi:MAG: outer membrane beta-barrel protein, partial [Muribaculaceae bacterium]|nr:outer membrane beta-barrel protein [Muribaculaceae bacterium]